MQQHQLGHTGPTVSAAGLGCMAMSGMYGPSDRAESIATIHAALDAGITLLDTGDFYGMGHNELLIAEAIRGVPREHVHISVKFGAQRGPDGSWLGYDARPQAVKTWLAYTLQRLGTDYIDVYRPARLDPSVPIEETARRNRRAGAGGYVRHIGLSEVGAGDDPPRRRGPSDRRSPDRIFADLARDRGGDPAGAARARHRSDRLRDPLARIDQRTLATGAGADPAISASILRVSSRAMSKATLHWSKRIRGDCRSQGRDRGASRRLPGLSHRGATSSR